MPLKFTHDATATPVIPSDAAANPDTNPTPRTPVASAPFEITPLLTIGVPPLRVREILIAKPYYSGRARARANRPIQQIAPE
jgi:hypothetical protein